MKEMIGVFLASAGFCGLSVNRDDVSEIKDLSAKQKRVYHYHILEYATQLVQNISCTEQLEWKVCTSTK